MPPSSPAAPAQSRRRSALCSAAALSQLCWGLVALALPARVPAPPAIPRPRARSRSRLLSRALQVAQPALPPAPLPSPPFGGVRAVRARVTFACSSMASWVGLPYFGSCLAWRKREPVGPGAVAWRECVAPGHVVPSRDGWNRASRSHSACDADPSPSAPTVAAVPKSNAASATRPRRPDAS